MGPNIRMQVSEKQLRRRVINALKKVGADPISVENGAYAGTPDVNCIWGWIELKACSGWPKRGGPLRLPHFVQQQRVWLRRRWNKNQRAWLLLQVASIYFLFDGATAAKILGHQPGRVLYDKCLTHWEKFPKGEELADVLH